MPWICEDKSLQWRARRSASTWCLFLILACLLFANSNALVQGQAFDDEVLTTESSDENITLRLRASWGGGPAVLWHGSLRVVGGEISDPVSLALDVDSSTAHHLRHGGLVIEPLLSREFDGAEFTVTGPADAELSWTLYDGHRSSGKKTGKVSLRELSRQPSGFPLDEAGNRLFIQRAPGDDLRIETSRDHLVFAPTDSFQFDLTPALTVAPPGSTLQCEIELHPARSDAVLWNERKSFTFDDVGTARTQSVIVPLPEATGAYTVEVRLVARNRARPLVRTKSIASRQIDLVVAPAKWSTEPVGFPSTPTNGPVPWELRNELDPSTTTWSDRIRQLDQLNLVSRFYSDPISNAEPQIEMVQGINMIRLEPGEWQAFPLSIEAMEQPHLLEVMIPSTRQQRLAVSIIDPDPNSQQSVTQIDSGVIVDKPAGTRFATGPEETLTHRLVFWPNSRAPWVVISNPDPSQPVFFSVIRVFDGPTRLTDAPSMARREDGEPMKELGSSDLESRRLVGPYLEKPILPESLMVEKLWEQGASQPIDDWYSFHLAVERFVDYLQYAGYSSAMVTVAADGSAWYPSETLRPSPKYDSGAFSVTGRDIRRKDVVELLLRHFDAAGLTLIPVLDLSGPLPALESSRRQGEERVLDQWNDRGQSRLQDRLSVGRLVGFYQPLEPAVRDALGDVIRECAKRYQDHESWRGLGIRIGPGSHLYLADGRWGLDPVRFAGFKNWLSEKRIDVEALTPADCLQPNYYGLWLEYRNGLYLETLQHLEACATEDRTSDQLFLVGTDWLQSNEMTRRLHPGVRGQKYFGYAAWTEVGFEPKQLKSLKKTTFMPGRGQASLWPAASRRVETVLFEEREAADLLDAPQRVGGLFHRTPAMLAMPQLAQITSSGVQQTEALIQPEFSPVASSNRRRFIQALAQSDCQTLFDGGWHLPLGQETFTAPLFAAYATLPTIKFDTLTEVNQDGNAIRLVVRQGRTDDATWWYLVNPCPWPCQVKIELSKLGKKPPRLLSRQVMQTRETVDGATELEFSLEPYDLLVMQHEQIGAELKKVSVDVSEEVTQHVEEDLNAFFARVTALKDQPAPLQVLVNPDLEDASTARTIPGWMVGRDNGVEVRVVDGSYPKGQQALGMRSRGNVAWVRSSPFALPSSGRLSLKVWLRTKDVENQPPLRLALEARCVEGEYYQFANIGSLAPENQPQEIGQEWTPFAVHFDDLPQEGVIELRVGFDLMGEGQVEIDHLQVFDRWFDHQDQRVMLQRVSAARLQIKQGNLLEPYQFLESYWPKLLSRSPVAKPSPTTDDESNDSSERTARGNRSMLDRVKTWVPTPSLPFR